MFKSTVTRLIPRETHRGNRVPEMGSGPDSYYLRYLVDFPWLVLSVLCAFRANHMHPVLENKRAQVPIHYYPRHRHDSAPVTTCAPVTNSQFPYSN